MFEPCMPVRRVAANLMLLPFSIATLTKRLMDPVMGCCPFEFLPWIGCCPASAYGCHHSKPATDFVIWVLLPEILASGGFFHIAEIWICSARRNPWLGMAAHRMLDLKKKVVDGD
ncbi:hypothetical protein ACLOJK_040908 [Asimina triloba]